MAETLDKRLELLQKVQPGDTISVTYLTVEKHNSWYTSLWRTWSGDSRHKVLTFLKETWEMMKTQSPEYVNTHVDTFTRAMESLQTTYQEDVDFNEQVNEIRKDIVTFLASFIIQRSQRSSPIEIDVVGTNSERCSSPSLGSGEISPPQKKGPWKTPSPFDY